MRIFTLLRSSRHSFAVNCKVSRYGWSSIYTQQSFLFRSARCALSTVSDGITTENRGAAAILIIGIPRETYNPWERRAPLTPTQVKQLINEAGPKRLAFTVQPSARRIFSDHEYIQAGAAVSDDLSAADVVMGVKRPRSESLLLPGKTYMFFSHTVKGQPENMGLLQEILRRNVQLIDYERITTDKTQGSSARTGKGSSQSAANKQKSNKRLVSFGRYAGIAGTLDSFHALGRKLLHAHGASTPFLSFPPAIMHDNLLEAKERVLRMGERICYEGVHCTEPLVFAVTGKGGCVYGGAMEILQMLPHEVVAVPCLANLLMEQQQQTSDRQHKIHVVPVDVQDVFERRNGDVNVDRHDFKTHPSEYRSLFAKRVAPYAHVIVNCAYWDARFPRLLTKRQMRRLREDGNERLLLVADISCDVHGSIEFLERTTTVENPCLLYDPIAEHEVEKEVRACISVLGVDILPSELPRESSTHFGEALVGVVKELLNAKEKQEEETRGIDTTLLSNGLSDACITTIDGALSPGFQYLKTLMNQARNECPVAPKSMILSFEGHLFDSGLINQILDVIEHYGSGVEFKECIFPPQSGRASSKSNVVLKIYCADETSLGLVETKISSLVDLIEKAEASVVRIDHNQNGDANQVARAYVEGTKHEKRVLLLGAGRVSRSFVEYLGRSGNTVITVASDREEAARHTASAAEKGRHVTLNVVDDVQHLSALIDDSDLVVSLLPAPMHPPVAMECIIHKTDLVTASYESEEMRSLNDRAMKANIVILNEVGLDPGLDHMSAMKIIDDVKSRGGKVICFSSVCGGLPTPEAANNPLKYKFSWSPKGVIQASQNDARYRWEGRVKEVQGNQLLQSAAPFFDAWHDLELECLPNRDSLYYEKVYGVQDAPTLFRGTLRYRGFSSLMNVLQNIGLFDSSMVRAKNWAGLVDELRSRRGGFKNVRDFVLACADDDPDEADRALSALDWLDMLGEKPVAKSTTVVDAFCYALEQELVYEEGERDMVLMHHTIEATFDDGSEERHLSSLQVVGDDSMSAMSKTVGFTAAASAKLLLGGTLKGERGLILPTYRNVYLPVLESLELEGIVFNESIVTHPPRMHQNE